MNLLLGLHYTPLKPKAPIPPARVSKLPNLFVVHGWTTRKSWIEVEAILKTIFVCQEFE